MKINKWLWAALGFGLASALPCAYGKDRNGLLAVPPKVLSTADELVTKITQKPPVGEIIDGQGQNLAIREKLGALVEPDASSLEKGINKLLASTTKGNASNPPEAESHGALARIKGLEALYSTVEAADDDGRVYVLYSLPGQKSGSIAPSHKLPDEELALLFSQQLEAGDLDPFFLRDRHQRAFYYRGETSRDREVFVRIDVDVTGTPKQIAFYRAPDSFHYAPKDTVTLLPQLGQDEGREKGDVDVAKIVKGEKAVLSLGENLGVGGIKLSADQLNILLLKGNLLDSKPVTLGGELFDNGGNVKLGLQGDRAGVNLLYDATEAREKAEIELPFSINRFDLSTRLGRTLDNQSDTRKTTVGQQLRLNSTQTRLSIDAKKSDDGTREISTGLNQALNLSREKVEFGMRLNPEQLEKITDPEFTVNIKDKGSPLSLELKSLSGGEGGGVTFKWQH